MKMSLTAKLCLSVVTLVVLIIASFVETSAQRKVYTVSATGRVASNNNASTSSIESDEAEIFAMINQERRRKGLEELIWDEALSRLAREYSQKMARENFFSHYDRDGEAVDGRARKMRIRNWNKIGENLFFSEGYGDPNSLAVRGWMKSPSHRENILDREFNVSGIGIAITRDGRIYVTQIFIKR